MGDYNLGSYNTSSTQGYETSVYELKPFRLEQPSYASSQQPSYASSQQPSYASSQQPSRQEARDFFVKVPETSYRYDAMIFLLIIAIFMSVVALGFGITAWQYYNNQLYQRNSVKENLRVASFGENVTVNNSTTDTLTLTFVLSDVVINTNPLILGIYLRSLAGNTTISDYPYIVQNNSVMISMPTALAIQARVVIQTLGTVSEYTFNFSEWTIVVAYRVPVTII